jgi:ectoine hydroxylase-related dioxygenase (phytanoyl-CoA dioxygenase family)
MISTNAPAEEDARPVTTAADREAFQRDGAVCVRALFTPSEVAMMARGIEANLAAPGPLAQVASPKGDPGFFVEDFCNWQRIGEYGELLRTSRLAQAAGELMGARTVRLYHDHLLVKEPRTAQKTPWHQDQPYYNIEGRDNISAWIPVDPVSREATLEFIAGSHRGPWYMPRSFMTAQAKWFQPGELAELPDLAADPVRYPVLGWDLSPGDAVFFHMLTLHGSPGVPGSGRRRVLSVRMLGDDIRHAPRPWKTSPEFPGLADELPAGAPMDHALFPVLWRA